LTEEEKTESMLATESKERDQTTSEKIESFEKVGKKSRVEEKVAEMPTMTRDKNCLAKGSASKGMSVFGRPEERKKKKESDRGKIPNG